MPLLRLENVTVLVYIPCGRLAAAGEIETTTVAGGAPKASVPPAEDRSNQAELVDPVHETALLPTFASVYVCDAGVKGPPTGPLAVIPAGGVTERSSGMSKASTKPAVVLLAGEVALQPMPRFAKADHNSNRLAPPLPI